MSDRRPPRGLTRREGLIALAVGAPAAALAACSTSSEPTPAAPTTTASANDVAEQVAADEASLVARYASAIAAIGTADTELAALLTDLRDQHAAHRDALGGAGDTASTTASAPTPTAGTTALVGELIATERDAARARIRACVAAEDPETARLLALIAASEAAHVPALRQARP